MWSVECEDHDQMIMILTGIIMISMILVFSVMITILGIIMIIHQQYHDHHRYVIGILWYFVVWPLIIHHYILPLQYHYQQYLIHLILPLIIHHYNYNYNNSNNNNDNNNTIYIYCHENPCDWCFQTVGSLSTPADARKYYDSAIAPREMYDQA